MKAQTHITAGRTAIRALLIAAVLTTAVVGTSGMTAAEPMDGKGNDVLYEAMDGTGNDVYPPPTQHSLSWIGGDTVTTAFPIDNFTVTADYAGRGGGSGKPGF